MTVGGKRENPPSDECETGWEMFWTTCETALFFHLGRVGGSILIDAVDVMHAMGDCVGV